MVQQTHLSKLIMNLVVLLGLSGLCLAGLAGASAPALAADNLAGLTGGLPALTSTDMGMGQPPTACRFKFWR